MTMTGSGFLKAAVAAIALLVAAVPAGAQDAAYRLSQLEEQMRQLVGQMQELQFEMRVLQRQLTARQGGAQPVPQPQPIQPQQGGAQQGQVQQGGGVIAAAPLPMPAPDVDETNTIVEVDPQTGTLPQTAAGPKALGTLPAGDVPGVVEGVETAQLGAGQASVGAPGSVEALYERSYNELAARQYASAETGFRQIVADYGSHELAGNAQYWLGETQFAQGRFKDAARSFLNGYKTYPKGRLAPNSLVKLGMSLDKLGQRKQACGAYAEVSKRYPSAAEARNLAIKEMKRAGC
jgi:tol-pal system protein YbgF